MTRAQFVLTRGADTIATEFFIHTGQTLTGELQIRGQGRALYELALNADATIRDALISTFPASPGSAASDRSSIRFIGDSVLVRRSAEGNQERRFGVPGGAMLVINPSFALIEQVIRRARALRRDSVQVPIFQASNATTVPATVVFRSGGGVSFIMAGVVIDLTLNGEGSVLGAVVPSQGVTVRREDL